MMRLRHRSAVGLAALALATGTLGLAACGDDDDDAATDTTAALHADIDITGAWARTSPKMATAGAAYFTITNSGDLDDALVAASVDPAIAARAEVHETVAAGPGDGTGDGMGADQGMGGDTGRGDGDGMMQMREVDRVAIPAGESVALEPGGYHVMLLDLAAPLETGDTIDLTLTFEESGEQVVTAEVRDQAP